MRKRYTYFFILTIAYFLIPFINISLALAGFVCLGLPFVILASTGRRDWCSSYCPRSYWLGMAGKWGRNRKAPGRLLSSKVKKGFLIFFGINFLFITMSSVMVGLGRMEPMDVIRFFIVIPTNWRLPQLLVWESIPPVILHLSYRMYSVMLSSMLAGTVMAILYKPRTWCAVCPVNTMSGIILKKMNQGPESVRTLGGEL